MAKLILELPSHPKIAEIIQNKKIEPNFKPTLETLSKILNCVGERGPSAKTEMARKTNLNYTRLAKHVVWMEKKGYVESIIDESKIKIKLTAEGKLFAKSISNVE